MEEIWKDIIIEKNGVVYDYTGLYQVSNLGRVRSLDRIDGNGHTLRGRILKLRIDNKGYQYVGLYKNGKRVRFSIHRLVATAFVPNPDNLPVVNHKDENPSNNVCTNLEWCTQKENLNYGTCQERRSEKMKGKPMSEEKKQKLIEAKKVKVICLETGQVFNSIKEAKQWIGKGDIVACLRGRQKSAGLHPETGQRLHWMYYEDYLAQQEYVESF